MKRCGKCNSLTDDGPEVCPHDGAALAPDAAAGELQATLGDKYSLTQLIGQGSMGAVYRARHRDLDEVAIKVMLGQKNNAQLSERFLREARALRRLRHPNAVLVYDLERSPNGVSFMVMEMVKGVSLRRELDIRRSLPLEDVVAIAEAVCAALQEAHEQGIIHRDIKPDNILIAEELLASGRTQKRIKLVDFGVVKLPDISPEGDYERPITRAGTPIGTPFYMSPEQWFGEGAGIAALDGRTDIYGLGCTLYEMLAGRVPFAADTTKEMRRLHLQTEPQPLAALAAGVPWPVSDVIMRALQKDRDERQASAEEFAARLRAAYDESFRETAQLSAERLAAARAAWGESDAPLNEKQLAPTFKSQSDEEEENADNYFRLAPTDSDGATEESEARANAPTEADLNVNKSSAEAWATTIKPDAPAPGETFLGSQARKTQRLESLLTAQGRLKDLTLSPQPPPASPETPPQITEESPAFVEPAANSETPSERNRETTTHQLFLPESVLAQTPPPLPEAAPTVNAVLPKEAVPPVIPPKSPPLWRKVALGSGLVGLLTLGGGALYWKWPRPDAPNVNQPEINARPGDVRLPGIGSISVNAPKDSVVYVDDERVGGTGDNGAIAAQAPPGLRNVRVQPANQNLRPFIQDARVSVNQTTEINAAFARPPETLAAAGPEARVKRAEELAAQSDFPAAEAEYRKALQEKAGDPEARQGLARVLAGQKRYAEALAELETVVRLTPKNLDLLRETARLQAIKNQDEGAERSLLQALRLAPRNSSLRADFALLLARQGGRLDDALREADLALKGRETAEALDAKARVLIERDQAAEALTLAERAAKREPREPAWQATLAVALARAGQTEAAREKFRPLKQKNGDPWSDLKTLSMLRFYGKHFLDTLDTLARG